VPTIEDVLLHSLAQDGDKYVFCAAVDFANPNPQQFDCSGLVQWSCNRAGVAPNVPRTSFQQARHCIQNQRDIKVEDAVGIRGALLFKFSEGVDLMTVVNRPKVAHVAWSLGNGSTIEAKGSQWGVGSFTADPARRNWTHAGLLPGVEYVSATTKTSNNEEDDEMPQVMYFKGTNDGEVHVYVVSGVVGKHLNPDALNLHKLFRTPETGSQNEPLPASWSDGLALLDGPMCNIPEKKP